MTLRGSGPNPVIIRNVSTRSLPDSLLPWPSPRACPRVNSALPDNGGMLWELNRNGVQGAVPHSLRSKAGIGVWVGVKPENPGTRWAPSTH